MSDDKFHGIEAALAHHERQIEDLSEMIRQQWAEIDTLKRRLNTALSRVKELEAAPDPDAPQTVTEIAAAEKPPPY